MHIPRVASDWVDAGLLKRPEEGETMEREGELVIQLPGPLPCLSWGLLSQHSVVRDCSIRANPLLRKSDHIPWALEQTTFPGGTVDSMFWKRPETNQLVSMNNCNQAFPFSTGFIIIVINFGALSRVSLFSHIFSDPDLLSLIQTQEATYNISLKAHWHEWELCTLSGFFNEKNLVLFLWWQIIFFNGSF